MLNPDPSKRPTPGQCIMHEVFMSIEDFDLFHTAIQDAMKQKNDPHVEAVFQTHSIAITGPEGHWTKTRHPVTREPLDPDLLKFLLKQTRYDTTKAMDLQRLIRNLRVHYPRGSGGTSGIETPELPFFMELYPRLFPLLFRIGFQFFPDLEIFKRRFQGDRFWINEALSNIDLLEGVSPINPFTPAAKTDPVAEIPEETIRKLKEELQEQKKSVKEQKFVISRLEGQIKGKEKGLEKAKAGQEKAKADVENLKADVDNFKAGQEKLMAENETLKVNIQEKESEIESLTEENKEKETKNESLTEEIKGLKQFLEEKEAENEKLTEQMKLLKKY
jgi:hypothetical protein